MGSYNSFKALGQDLAARFNRPVRDVTFWTNAFCGIFLFAGLGIWFEIVKFFLFNPDGNATIDGMLLAFNTYFPAVGCAAAQQFFLAVEQKSYLRSFGYLVSVIFMMVCILSLVIAIKYPVWSLGLGILFSILAFLVWWVANGDDTTFQDPDPEGPIGGDPSGTLPGYTEGFSV
jgi:hypothetical protein